MPGTVFLIAKHEFEVKRSTVLKVADEYPALEDIVEAGKQASALTVCVYVSIQFRHHSSTALSRRLTWENSDFNGIIIARSTPFDQ